MLLKCPVTVTFNQVSYYDNYFELTIIFRQLLAVHERGGNFPTVWISDPKQRQISFKPKNEGLRLFSEERID